MIEKRTLPMGIGFNGAIHTALEISPRLVRHLLAASNSATFKADPTTYEICCLAEQIVRLGDIPKEEITAALLLDMFADDFDVLTEAAQMARQRASSFRGERQNDKAHDAGPGEAGLQPG